MWNSLTRPSSSVLHRIEHPVEHVLLDGQGAAGFPAVAGALAGDCGHERAGHDVLSILEPHATRAHHDASEDVDEVTPLVLEQRLERGLHFSPPTEEGRGARCDGGHSASLLRIQSMNSSVASAGVLPNTVANACSPVASVSTPSLKSR